ncbi:MAG TPA: DUF4382 domain-containing protein [Acidobacteriaceae bacterium]|nr:DUF4382 domain-containing protein [Acidobacteriaceae bacterium]
MILWAIVGMALVGGAALVVQGCGNSTTAPASGMAKVSVEVSDPATCQAPSGPYSHVYVTITDVVAHTSASAGASDSGWVDLTPNLSKAPKQVDLLGLANNSCFLASLGDTQEIQAGNYQQFRVILADNSSQVSGNVCGSATNCVMLTAGGTYPLELSSESKTGIKIPSGQIASGGFNISAGQTKDLDIDFNTCISIVQEGNGKYRLKPVLHAGEVSTTSSSINGVVVDSMSGKAIAGPAIVALEQKDSAGIDRVFMTTMTDAGGGFVFCPLPAGTYDVVVVGTGAGGVVYSPSVIVGVPTGSSVGQVPMYALPIVSVAPATLGGEVTSQTSANAGTVADVQVSALEQVGSALTVTIPLVPTATQTSAVLAVETAVSGSCPTGTDCVDYTVDLPAGTAFTGAYSTSGTTLTQSSIAAAYQMDGIAFVPSSGGTTDCSPSEETAAAVVPVPAVTTNVATLKFGGCQ